MQKIWGPKSASFDELNGQWVTFPNGKSYLLPVLARETKLVPQFDDEDGDVSLVVQHGDDELAALVDRFLALVSRVGTNPLTGDVVPKVNGQGQLVVTPAAYAEVVKMLKALLNRNYSFSNGELGSILSLTRPQLGQLISAVVTHLLRE